MIRKRLGDSRFFDKKEKMKVPENIVPVVNKKIFENYIFNENHLLGRHKKKYLEELGFEQKDISYLIEQLKMFPTRYEIKITNLAKKSRFLSYQIYINGNLISYQGKKIPVKTYWIYEQNKIIFLSLVL